MLVFQPHQYSRTHELFDEFVACFDQTDELILADVYEVEGRNEDKVETSKDLAKHIRGRGTVDTVLYGKDLQTTESHLRDSVQKGDVIVFMGAGDIDDVARKLV